MITFRQPFRGDYPITLDYGEAFPPLYTHESPHPGIDYGCPEGTEILACADGRITVTGRQKMGYGTYIVLNVVDGRDNYFITYAHLSSILVNDGQTVKRGDIIGLSGNTGTSTGPHLHFEVRKNNIVIDPKTMLRNEIDSYPSNYTPMQKNPEFEPVRAGFCMVVCDAANVRCHCDMSRVMGVRKKGDVIAIADEVTMYNGLPYRDYYDPEYKCWLRIAEHDPYTQMIVNTEI